MAEIWQLITLPTVFFAEEHTGVAVPLHANELGRPLIKTLMTQPEIFGVTREFLGL